MEIKDLRLVHDFLVVDSLVTPVILGIKFLQDNQLILDFSCVPVEIKVSRSVTMRKALNGEGYGLQNENIEKEFVQR